MTERGFYHILLWAWLGAAAAVCVLLFFVTAPYGRHLRRGWGPTVASRLGWILMEAPSPLVFAALFLLGDRTADPVNCAFLALWLTHYVYRAFLFPLGLHERGKRMPMAVVSFGALFNLGNAYLNGRWLNLFGPAYGPGWFADPRFIFGTALFLVGFAVHARADRTLVGLRAPGETGYKIPRGGLFRWVFCPNYLGELVQWGGWALATWSLAGLAFFLWTAANLVPRARSNHRWYREKFPDYPPERRALVPRLF